MSLIQPILENLAELGVYDFFMPFLLILAVVFGVLQNKKVISEEVSVNAVVAIAVSFLATYTLRGFFFTQLFGMAGMVIAAGVVLVILLALLGIKPEDVFSGAESKSLGLIVGLLIVFAIFVYAMGTAIKIDEESVATVAFLVVIFLAVYFMAKGSGSK